MHFFYACHLEKVSEPQFNDLWREATVTRSTGRHLWRLRKLCSARAGLQHKHYAALPPQQQCGGGHQQQHRLDGHRAGAQNECDSWKLKTFQGVKLAACLLHQSVQSPRTAISTSVPEASEWSFLFNAFAARRLECNCIFWAKPAGPLADTIGATNAPCRSEEEQPQVPWGSLLVDSIWSLWSGALISWEQSLYDVLQKLYEQSFSWWGTQDWLIIPEYFCNTVMLN